MNIGMFFLIALAVLPALGAFFGLTRGFKKTTFRLITVIAAFVIALLFTTKLVDKVLTYDVTSLGLGFEGSVEGYIVNLLESNEQIAQFLNLSPSLKQLILAFPGVIVAEILFVVLFFVLKFVFWFVYFIVSVIFLRTPKGKCKFRLLGIVVGAVQGALVLFVILVPVLGLLNFSTAAIDVLSSEDFASMEGLDTVKQINTSYIDPINDSQGMQLLEKTKVKSFAQKIFDKLSTVELGEGDQKKKVALFYDIQTNILPSIGPLMKVKDLDIANLSVENIGDLRNMLEDISNSEIITNVLSEVVSNAAEKIKNGEEFMGLDLSGTFDSDPEMKEIVDNIFDTLSNVDGESIGKDLGVIVDVFDLINEYQVENPVGEGEEAKDQFAMIADVAADPEFNQKLINILSTEGSTFADAGLGDLLSSYLNNQTAE